MGEATLIDTHILFWLVSGSGPSSQWRDRLADPSVAIWVSTVSAFELSLKVSRGRFDAARSLVGDFSRVVSDLLARELPVTSSHALRGGSLDWDHRDPFDRLLVAQAQVEGLALITADRAVLGAPGVDLRPWT